MKSTIEDVAKLAGVSITTVSRVINNNYPVKTETRINVEKAIQQLSYQPNPMARGLIMKKSKTIGIVVPSITNMFFTEVIHGIEKSIKLNNYDVLLSNSNGDAVSEKNCVEKLINRFVDGVIVITPNTANMKNGFYDKIARDIPLICINGYNKDAKVNFVLSDEENGTKVALDYLVSLGHKKIAFVRCGDSYSYDVKEKIYESYMTKLKENMLVVDIKDGNSIDVVKNTTTKIVEEICKEYVLGMDITAFFACNDLMAAGILNACGEVAIEVPKEISIVGFDNIILSEMTRIKLTTVDQNMKIIGAVAAENIIKLIESDELAFETVVIDTELVIRESCQAIQGI
jgi:LacI family transcriptional regulator